MLTSLIWENSTLSLAYLFIYFSTPPHLPNSVYHENKHFSYLFRPAVQKATRSPHQDFMKLSLIVQVVLLDTFCFCMFFKRAAVFNIVKYDLSPPLPTLESSDRFQSMFAELDYIMHSIHVHHQNCTSQSVWMWNELLRLQNPSSSELILLANTYQRWVVKGILFLQFSFIPEALSYHGLWFPSVLIKLC